MKKNILSALGIILLSVNAISQVDSTKRNKKILVGIVFSPAQSYRALKATDNFGEGIVTTRNNSEIPISTFSAGIAGAYFFTKHIGLNTGFFYSQKGQGTKPLAAQSINTQTGFVNSSTSYWFHYKVNYLDIPIQVSYLFLDKKIISLQASTGIINNIFLNQETVSYKSEGSGKPTKSKGKLGENTKGYALSWVISAGIDFNIKKFKLQLAPSYNRFITAANSDNIKTYYYNLGWNIGVYYTLFTNTKNADKKS